MVLFFSTFGSFISTALYFLELSDKDVDESFRYHYFLSVTSLYSPPSSHTSQCLTLLPLPTILRLTSYIST
jgi:hypothetical protein